MYGLYALCSIINPSKMPSDPQWLQDPALRLATIQAAGRAQVPYTSGILIGIGETRAERVGALQAIKLLHDEFGHIQVSCCSPRGLLRLARVSQQAWAAPSLMLCKAPAF